VRVEIFSPGAGVHLEGDVVVLPPGLPSPADASAVDPLRAYALAGGRVLGLGDSVAWLCAAGLLPGAVTRERPSDDATHVRVEGRATAFTWAIPAGRIVAHAAPAGRARYFASDDEVSALAARGRVVFRHCDGGGGVTRRSDDHAATVAGLSDETGRIVGLFGPSTPALDTELGRQLLSCLGAR
jgi:phosphoribosylformylglycinamidine (FGAM) synthase-like amidotransferase family enzyme